MTSPVPQNLLDELHTKLDKLGEQLQAVEQRLAAKVDQLSDNAFGGGGSQPTTQTTQPVQAGAQVQGTQGAQVQPNAQQPGVSNDPNAGGNFQAPTAQ